jgi:CheY-like chemotaxis protein
MLVDDDEDDIDMFKQALNDVDNNLHLVTANNGEEALDKVLSGIVLEHIFLDINMPIMGGIQCLEELSRRKKIPPPEVTMYTTSGKDVPEYQKCIKLGASFATKPNSYDGIVQLIKKQLHKSQVI